MKRIKTQVGIVGAGPAGLVLARLLQLAGIDSVVIELRSRQYAEKRIRAGVLEQTTVDLLHCIGMGERMSREGLVHHGIDLAFLGRRHRIDMAEFCTQMRSTSLRATTLQVATDSVASAGLPSRPLPSPSTTANTPSPGLASWPRPRRPAKNWSIKIAPAASPSTACVPPSITRLYMQCEPDEISLSGAMTASGMS